ncbi:MAG: DUF3516 domain-containing protein, partial [Deltaproteobacteria bacterium]|nr:DUF3516 domain-containing protein [Deltaproteobacteria bacterium]
MRTEAPLAAQLDWLPPRVEDVKDDQVLERFLAYVEGKGLTLYPAQEEAILELYARKNVILATPTGSGKSLVATALAFLAVARGLRLYYTCPIKALVSEKFFALCEELGPEWVGMVTGDASVNPDAPILCCTAEILSNLALREGAAADVDLVVMDEFHYYADPDRGVAWQIPLLELRHAGFLLLSATLGPTARFEEALREVTGCETVTVRGMQRPVPLEFEYRETPLHETIADLVKRGRAPIYLVSFSQRAAAEQAQNLLSVDHATKEEKQAIHAALVGVRFDSPYGKELSRLLRHGVGLHHAGLLPKYRRVVERLAQKGLLRVVSGTDTLGVGVNVPIRTVLLTQLCKYDGQKTSLLTVRDFHQLAGRAGRRGFDDRGTVVAQAPEHVIENLRIDSKIAADPAKRKKLVKRKPPDRGYVHWDRATFDRLVTGEPEPLESRFAVNHGMILSVLGRPGGGCLALGRLIRRSHERPARQRIHGRRALELVGSLRTAGILSKEGGKLALHAELPEDFSLHQALSLYLVHAVDALAGASEAYALDLLSAVESILENPVFVLQRQLDAVKTRTMAELKAAGVPYEERIEALEKLEYPMPNRDFAYDTFNEFAKLHPWVKEHAVRPKSIARELV